jgi:hypothetical protein
MTRLVPDGHGGWIPPHWQDCYLPNYWSKFDKESEVTQIMNDMAMQEFRNFIEANRQEFQSPDFSKAYPDHDWRNHVPWLFQDLWSDLSLRERALIFYMAQLNTLTEDDTLGEDQ